jgi:hypothetical protein
MRDPRTGQRLPCPICNSTAVRWRGRGAHDVVFTGLRYIVELFASIIQGSPGSRMRYRATWGDVRGNYRDEMREARTGWKTARWFWRCPDCHQKGQVW